MFLDLTFSIIYQLDSYSWYIFIITAFLFGIFLIVFPYCRQKSPKKPTKSTNVTKTFSSPPPREKKVVSFPQEKHIPETIRARSIGSGAEPNPPDERYARVRRGSRPENLYLKQSSPIHDIDNEKLRLNKSDSTSKSKSPLDQKHTQKLQSIPDKDDYDNCDDEEACPFEEEDCPTSEFHSSNDIAASLGMSSDLHESQNVFEEEKHWNPILTLRSHFDAVRSVNFHSHEPLLLSTSEDGSARLWNLQIPLDAFSRQSLTNQIINECSNQPTLILRGHRDIVTSSTFIETQSNDSQLFAATGSIDSNIIIWKLPNIEDIHEVTTNSEAGRGCIYKHQVLTGHSDAIWSVISHSSGVLLSAAADNSLCTWAVCDIFDNEEPINQPLSPLRQVFSGSQDNSNIDSNHIHTPNCLAIDPLNQSYAIVGHTSGLVVYYNIEMGQWVNTFHSGSLGFSRVCDIATHPTCPLSFTAHVDRTIRYWDTRAGVSIRSFRAHTDCVTSLSVEPLSGFSLATCSHDSNVRFWDISTGCLCHDLAEHQTHRRKYNEGIHCIRHHPSLPIISTGGADSTVKVFL